jgi:SAM-dependent methyltransferase
MSNKLHRDYCPSCGKPDFFLPRPNLQPHPYVECTHCGLVYQQNFPPNTAAKEGAAPFDCAAPMSQAERDVNQSLAAAIAAWFPPEQASKYALDVGAGYPWLAHCFGNLGWHSYAIDKFPVSVQATQDEALKVAAYQFDFEAPPSVWPWDAEAGTAPSLQFDLITAIHVINYFHHPLQALAAMFELLKPGGILFLRCPDSEAAASANHFSADFQPLHPQIWNQRALEMAGMKIGFAVKETYPLFDQRDMVLIKPLLQNHDTEKYAAYAAYAAYATPSKFELGVGMIVKNEEDDLPACLDSLGDVADLMCIVDTGSTDRTLAVIAEWANAHQWQVFCNDLPTGVLPHKSILLRTYTGASEQDEKGDWKLWHFGQARNEYVKTLDALCHWLLWIDADDILLAPEKLRPLLAQPFDVYGLGIVDGASTYNTRFIHHRLWRTGMGIHYQGACHEYPYWPPYARVDVTTQNIQHRWTVSANQEAGPSRNLRILEREYQHGVRTPRVLFYLGNTLREAGQHQKAIEIYQEYMRQPIGFWDEWMFCALFKMRCERQIAYQTGDYAVFFASLFEALGKDQRFSEIAMEGAYAYYDLGLWNKSVAMCYLALQTPPDSQLFVEFDKYTDQPHKFLAYGHNALGNAERAVFHAGEYLKRVPGDVAMREQFGDI